MSDDKSCEGCVHRRWVEASPSGTSRSGWGCNASGGHAVERCERYQTSPLTKTHTYALRLTREQYNDIEASIEGLLCHYHYNPQGADYRCEWCYEESRSNVDLAINHKPDCPGIALQTALRESLEVV